MNHKIMCSVAVFSFCIVVTCETPDKYKVLARVMLDEKDLSKAQENIMSNLVPHIEYRMVDTYKHEIPAQYKIKQQRNFLENDIVKKYNCVQVVDPTSNSVIFFDTANTSQLTLKLKWHYSRYKEHNNGYFYNRYDPLYIHLIDDTNVLCENQTIDIDNVLSFKLQPEQIEDVLGLYDIKIWRTLKELFVMLIIAMLARNYSSELMQLF